MPPPKKKYILKERRSYEIRTVDIYMYQGETRTVALILTMKTQQRKNNKKHSTGLKDPNIKSETIKLLEKKGVDRH